MPATDKPDAMRVRTEDALKHMLTCDEAGRGATVDSLAGAMAQTQEQAATLLGHLRARGLAEATGDTHNLSEGGRTYALQVVRTHRIYETWLARETGLPAENWHGVAHKAEHRLSREDVDAMADKLGNPRYDPHGDPIPTREGQMPRRALTALTSWTGASAAVIEHIEDEPASLFRQAIDLGMAPGTRLDGISQLPDGAVGLSREGEQIRLPAPVAALIHVRAVDPDALAEAAVARLSSLAIGGESLVIGLAPSCIGAERRRLLDLGVVPGTRIRCEFASPFGTPRSYTIRGAMIALRDSQADRVLIHPPEVLSPQ